ncbi:MAG TPA: hypothetical protein VKX30_07675 [Flavobacteriaceae bacterium]|nr:hypothetical protein [Flavobacteriaceae bacterium]
MGETKLRIARVCNSSSDREIPFLKTSLSFVIRNVLLAMQLLLETYYERLNAALERILDYA